MEKVYIKLFLLKPNLRKFLNDIEEEIEHYKSYKWIALGALFVALCAFLVKYVY